jgi:hypothetical protein
MVSVAICLVDIIIMSRRGERRDARQSSPDSNRKPCCSILNAHSNLRIGFFLVIALVYSPHGVLGRGRLLSSRGASIAP